MPNKILVWDLPTRLFHWALVILIGVSWASAEIGGNAMQYHLWSGFAVLTLVLFRVLWGVIGSDTARFSQFMCGPAAVRGYARSLFDRNAKSGVGHNPLGGWMVAAMLLALLVQASTGLFANDDIATEGPLYKFISKDLSDLLSEVHEAAFNVIIALAVIHIAAILFYRVYKHDNLVRPMLTGAKDLPEGAAQPRMTSAWLALPAITVAAFAVYWLVTKL